MSSSFGAHRPADQDDSKTLLTQPLALGAGAVASAVVGYVTLFNVIPDAFLAFGHLFLILLAAYTAVIAVRFWKTKAYKGGMTLQELVLLALWPVDYVRRLIARRKGQDASFAASGWSNVGANGNVGIPELGAKAIGVVVTIIAFYLFFPGISSALSIIGTVLWVLFIGYLVGALLFFWVAESWRDGLTVNEAKDMATWPASV